MAENLPNMPLKITEADFDETSDILSVINDGASFLVRQAAVGTKSNEVCSNR